MKKRRREQWRENTHEKRKRKIDLFDEFIRAMMIRKVS